MHVTAPRSASARPFPALARIGWLILALAAPMAGAQVRPGGPVLVQVEPDDVKGSRPLPMLAPSGVGNEVYRVYVDGASDGSCGAWTATTGTLHEAGPGANVLYGNGNPGTSDTTLWSWTSGQGYRTGGAGAGCNGICNADSPSAAGLFRSGIQTGWRLTWRFVDGGNTIELVQEVEVMGPVDGTQTVQDSAIRETHVVRNLGPGTFRFGLRKHWDWQIDFDDGPWFATCDHVTAACDRSMNFHASGAGTGVYPPNYVINEDPASALCPDGVVPRTPGGCGGNPVYIVAGTVAPPSTLVPPPDAPEVLSFNSWTQLINDCWDPGLVDRALCGVGGSPSDDTAIAYFYGMTSATAEILTAGEERSFTQYVVAAEEECPEVVDPPAVDCDAGGPYERPCTGPQASILMDGTATVGEGEPIISWTHDCAGGSFDDPSAEDPILTFDVDGCSSGCSVTMTVSSTAGGGTSTCTTWVSVRDDQAPSLTCPAPLTVECSGGGIRSSDPAVQAWLASAAASDACNAATITHDMPAFVPATGCRTERLVTWTARDACGNAATCSRLIFIEDRTAPVVTPPADSSLDCGDPPGDRDAWRATATATDACDGNLPVSSMLLSTESPCPGTIVETWEFRAVDSCGRVGTATATWAVGDATPPVVTPPAPDAIECGPGADAAEQAWLDQATALDACQGARPIVRTLVEVLPGCPGEEIRRWRFSADDGCGNAAEEIAELSVRDTTAPGLVGVPSDATVSCDAVPPPATVSATDACDPAPAVVLSETAAPGPCPQESMLTRTWTATDACGNEASLSQVLTIVDEAAPQLMGVPGDATISCDAVPPPAAVSAVDSCDPAPSLVLVESSVPGPCPQESTLTRTWTATDACGNEASLSQVLTIVDEAAPQLTGVPGDATVSCDAVPPPALVGAIDSCDPAPSVVLAETTAPGSCPQESTLTRTWTATDACGNAASLSQILTIVDDAAPQLTGVPGDVTVSCDTVPPPAGVGATDACDPAPAVTLDEQRVDDPACADRYDLVRTWTATDACGNSASRTQVVRVQDTAAPVLSGVPADATVSCDAVPAPPPVSASDDCTPNPAVMLGEIVTPGSCPNERTITRTWTTADRCGNTASSTQVLQVVDTTPPQLAAPASLVVECPAPASGPGSESAWMAAASATDTCGPATVQSVEILREPGCGGTYRVVREFWAVDACALESPRVQREYRVVDTIPPVISAPAPRVVECPAPAAGPGSEAAWIAEATAADGCGAAAVMSRELVRQPGCGGTIRVVREFWAVDACALESARVQSEYRVVDTTPPSLVAPAPVTAECPAPASGPGSEADWMASASASDSCGPALVESRELLREAGCGGTIRVVREFWAVDACGLRSAPEQSEYVVVDTTPPEFSRGGDQFDVAIWPPNHGYVVFLTAEMASASDACSAVDLRVTGCSSSQPEDVHQGRTDDGGDAGNGDGHFGEDCVIAVDGSAFAVRAERLGGCGKDSERRYVLELTARDECGNEATAPGTIRVGHDRSAHEEVSRGRHLPPNAPPPFPWLHPTVYGTGCGTER